jgi:predicted nucleic acid-binding protein
VIVDAGALLEVLLGTAGGRRAEGLLLAGEQPGAPELLDAEVLHRLLLLEKAGALTARQVDQRIARLADAPIRRLPHTPLLPVARRLGASMSGYDALYAAAALELDRPLLTTDARLARTCGEQHGILVTLIPTGGR